MNVEDKKNNSPISNKMRDNKDISLRPESLNEFIGQTTLCDNLKIFMQATKKRKEALENHEKMGSRLVWATFIVIMVAFIGKAIKCSGD